MINWIDILSPRLRHLHRDWIHFRAHNLMPAVGDYNGFARAEAVEAAQRHSATVILPAESGPLFKHVGDGLNGVLPSCRSGMHFSDLASPVLRAALTGPFHRIASSRQPEARRSHTRGGNETSDYEMLLLPFCDSRLRVCIIHAVYDLAGIDWKRAFA
ncbi:MAG: hypothetical protein ACK4FJ_07660 [Ferrovibrio sp.]|uniref:hypothetical protein n=1 Tax=Ferrovibrio sp. TaxID=1917215 RepID=UPI00391B4787